MSLQRVLELARRQNMAVVVTDVAGREPLVVLPLDTYERLLDQPPASEIKSRSPEPPKSPPSAPPQTPQAQTPVPKAGSPASPQQQPIRVTPSVPQDTLRVRQRDEDRVTALHRSLDVVSEPSQATPTAPTTTGDLFVEERFAFQG